MQELVLNKISISDLKRYRFYIFLKKYFKFIGFESLIWISGLIYLAFFSPIDQTHFTICPLANMGFNFCPGCGLGHSITQLFHGNFVESFNTHPLGLFALIIILYRIYTLLKTNIINIKKAKA